MRYFVLVLLFISCTKEHEVKYRNGVYFFEEIKIELSNLTEVDWKVGTKREKNVSKGFRFAVDLPKVDSDAQKLLAKNYGADSWLYRVIKVTRGNKQTLAHLYYSFSNMTRTSKYFTLSTYYPAAAASKRFRLFHCPAFAHRKKITGLETQDTGLREDPKLYVRPIEKVPASVTRLRFAPMVISGGASLKATYFIEYALYNSQTKQRLSSWNKSVNMIQIQDEDEISIPSCAGIKEEQIPLPESKMPTLEDLQIK